MIRYTTKLLTWILFIELIILVSCQDQDSKYLQGNWYYFDADKHYHEIYFNDSIYIDCDAMFGCGSEVKYKTICDTIIIVNYDNVLISKHHFMFNKNRDFLTITSPSDTLQLKRLSLPIKGLDIFSVKTREQLDEYEMELFKRRNIMTKRYKKHK